MDYRGIVVGLIIYGIVAGVCIRALSSRWKLLVFCGLNLVAIYVLFTPKHEIFFKWGLVTFYPLVIALEFVILRYLVPRYSWGVMVGILAPIVWLVVGRCFPTAWLPHVIQWGGKAPKSLFVGEYFIGASYMAFRLSYSAIEVRATAATLSWWEYFGFCFFPPTFLVGPISPYQKFLDSLRAQPQSGQLAPSLLRITIGATKYLFLAIVLSRLTYQALLLDGKAHSYGDLAISVVAYYLYLYCNFSGFCDVVIGTAGLLGIEVAENFEDPLLTRNLKEFWNRWHITLSTLLRNLVFSPLSKLLVQRFGAKSLIHVASFSTLVVFLMMGIWHGGTWNFLIYGALHGVGMAVHYYYAFYLKKGLTKEQWVRYQQNIPIRVIATALTFAFVSGSLFFFANDGKAVGEILKALS